MSARYPAISRAPQPGDEESVASLRSTDALAFPNRLRFLRALGAKLGAIRCGLLRTAMDGYGQRTGWFRTLWTAADFYGRPASIYGSEGWGFEFLRACQRCPCGARTPSRRGPGAFREKRLGSHSLHCDPNRGSARGPEPPNPWQSEPLKKCRYGRDDSVQLSETTNTVAG